jgi:hypothetical protein
VQEEPFGQEARKLSERACRAAIERHPGPVGPGFHPLLPIQQLVDDRREPDLADRGAMGVAGVLFWRRDRDSWHE